MYFVFNIPDIDTDAYVHHSIARQIILSPGDLSIHWVWLPLFHYISSLLILLGADYTFIRILNIFIWASVPVILFFFIYNQKNKNSLLIAFLSSIICALFPIGILMGTTAQPEPLFSLLILLFIIFISKKKYFLSSIFLTLASMLRYEAWAVICVVSLIYLFEIKNEKKIFSLKILNIILPVAFILLWAFLREPFDGKLFGFLFQTQQFANDALKESNSFQGGFLKIILDFIHYPIVIPALFMGISLLFVPFGLERCIKENKWILYSGLGILAFITLSWMFKSNLGLNRHFVALIPLYSTLSAYGLLKIIDFLKNFFGKSGLLKKLNIKYTILVIVFASAIIYLIMWLYIWNKNFENQYPDKKSTAEFLKNIPDNKTIFCNDAIVEIFSKIDYKRFDRTWMENNPGIRELILQTAKKEGYVYVITTDLKWKNLNNIGEIIYTSPPNKESNSKILVLKIE